ncbi:hypothetical protein HDU96_009327 [Phlyctochytrium bullatum]|nr:hypothetical protein HDU96_009327 [Phlyctochytrium bullatum]
MDKTLVDEKRNSDVAKAWLRTTPLPPISSTDGGGEGHPQHVVHDLAPHRPLHPSPEPTDKVAALAPSKGHVNDGGRPLHTPEDHLDLADHDHVHEEPMLVSLRVCKGCQGALMGAFEHCLSRHANISSNPGGDGQAESELLLNSALPGGGSQPVGLLDSIHQIDEVADGKRLTNPPYFEIIKDPTEKLNTLYEDLHHKIERDRHVFYQTKAAKAGEKPTPSAAVTGRKGGGPRFFSGSLYKRTLEAKDREIRFLRERLYDRTVAEKREHTNVEKLRVALNKSMRFYMYAEEWQMNETARLQQDVRLLKAEMSSLMAFLINSEEEKRMLLGQIEEVKEQVRQKDEKIAEIDGQRANLKAKLHESFKEFLVMSDTISRLKKEAEHGSDSIISRNEILQKNLDKLSRDFERSTQDLAAAQVRIKELEFELEEIVIQFNITGEAKRMAEDLNIRLTSEVDVLTKDNTSLKTSLDSKTAQASQLEKELHELSRLLEQTRYDLENKAGELSRELDITLTAKKELEISLKAAKSEIDKLSSALKSVTRSKDQLESAFRTTVQKHDREINVREEKIMELQNHRSDDARTIKRLQEQKEQLMFQVTDLQNNLDRELANVNILSFELAQVKRNTEERITSLEEQVEKLNAAKVNLANDKRLLTDKVRMVRTDLKKKEEEFDELSKLFDAYKENSSLTEAGLREELAKLQSAHTTLTVDHRSLEQKQTVLIETNVELSMKQEALTKKLAEMNDVEKKLLAQVKELEESNATLTESTAVAVSERNEMKIHLDSVLTKIEDLKQTMAQQQTEAANTIKEKSEQIVVLTSAVYKLQEEEKRLNDYCKSLKERLEALEAELAEVKAALEAETYNREQFEMHCYELRTSLTAERRLRLEFERMQSRVDKHAAERVLDKLEAMKVRDRRMNGLAKSLKAEHTRLKDISTILPKDSDLLVIEGPELSSFLQHAATLQNNTGIQIRSMAGGAEVRPDMRVTVAKLNA